MKKRCNLIMFCVFMTTITYGNVYDSTLTTRTDKCKDNLGLFCPYVYHPVDSLNNGLIHTVNAKRKYSLSKYAETKDRISLVLIDSKLNKEMEKMKKRENYITLLVEKQRLNYQLHTIKVFGQLTNPVNMEENHHKSQAPRVEGFGLRFRF